MDSSLLFGILLRLIKMKVYNLTGKDSKNEQNRVSNGPEID